MVRGLCPVPMYTDTEQLSDDKSLGQSKLKTFADDKINVTENLKFVLRKAEKIVGKGENACLQHCLLFLQCCFQQTFLPGSLKVGIVW